MTAILFLSIIFLAGLAHASFQLSLGGFLLLYHSAKGRFVSSRSKTLVSNYCLGAIFMLFLSLTFSIFFVYFFGRFLDSAALYILVFGLIALALLIWFAYYRSKSTTELWLPRSVSKYINLRAKKTSSRIEAFSLGMLTILAEFPFSFLLSIVSAYSLINLPKFSFLGFFFYIFLSLLPIILARIFLRRGSTVAKIQRWRVKYHRFICFASGIFVLVLAFYILSFMGEGIIW